MKWLWALIPLLGFAEWGLHVAQVRGPDGDAWQQLRPSVEALRQPGDLVLITPLWEEPNARWALGEDLMPLRDVARPDLARYAAVLEVSLFGKHASELAGYAPEDERRVGPFTLTRWRNPEPVRVEYDFVDRAAADALEVRQGEGKRTVVCPWSTGHKKTNGALFGHPTFPADRFQCVDGEWSFVGVTVIDDEAYRPRRCLWAHPARGGLSIEYAHASLGATLQGYGGLPYFTSRDGTGSPVKLEAFVAGVKVGEYEHKDGEGWTPFAFDTRRWAGNEANVEFRISSERLGRREFCFHADARSPVSAGDVEGKP